MKILEAHSLLESAETRLKAYENMREEMAALKKQFKGMANLDDAMTGKGANAIKAFYNEQAEGAGLWLDLIDMKIAFFKSVPREIESAKFDDNAYVEESYLDSELNNAIQKADGIIDAHHKDMKSILHSIDDIISLTLFDKSTVTDQLDKADHKRKKTITDLHKLDEKLKSDYEAAEALEQEVQDFFETLTGSTNKGKSIDPITFNAKAFHETDAYKKKADIQKQAHQYLKVKQQEEIKHLQTKLDKTTDPDEYLKIADELGADNLTAEQLQYYSNLVYMKGLQETGRILADSTKGFVVALWDAGKDIVIGAYDLAVGSYDLAVWSYRASGKMGIKEQVKAGQEFQNVIYSAPETFDYMVESFKKSWNDNMIHGDAYSRSHYVTYAIASLFGAKGLGKVSSTTKAGKFVTKETKAFLKDQKDVAKNITEKAKPYFKGPNTNRLEPALQGAGGFENPVSKLEKELDKKQENYVQINGSDHSKAGKIESRKTSHITADIQTVEQAHQWGSKYYDNWIESLTPSEQNSIKQYTGDDYKKINDYLRGISDSLDGIDLDTIYNIKNGLDKARVPHTMQVYRGTDLRPLESLIEFDKYGDVNAESLIGKTFRDNGFVSTAIVKESSFDHMKVSWEINVPAGANAAYIGKISHFPNEAELLLNFGQEMLIKSARVDSSNKLHIVLDLI
ncbi:T7SS effector LXG polymorphic toxin [Bacillus atrophaeus]|uniref:T7SS effector LXG polymorphic toxin n=1 Tax=Bacillus atrophaeus TaxID=1452 RepID=UPI00227E385F|nr:T7SS effector LXG polymorphic toxin [Bacillus atrophaeus]MCY8486170.1 T7SS effector LXG polymorphic toxin [Bacillus atrophaeus]MCY8497137.1 T7SS effector LXG polymorphic toxin [Bacillus atrophaeus]MCY8813865.1 T7SS effector LXG polymorphic toxin [Bacillus atrophaeus]MCY8819727.1 T7SS effector LXG polymorphic toxin [Bacillus atrophaeus]MCY8828285.1 T7SS effector LXG polymorphic toxin [Bacillus atrophaeus]